MPKKLTLSQKLQVVDEAAETGNVRKTAAKWNVYPSTIRKWRKNYENIKEGAAASPRKLTLHPGAKAEAIELETQLYDWVTEQREAELAVSTLEIIDKALSINPQFKNGNAITLQNWVYRFMKRHSLSVRSRTRVSQVTQSAMQSVRQQYCRHVMTSYANNINNPHYLINMDETAIYLNCSPKRTVHSKGEKTVPIMLGGTSGMRFTLAVSVAMDGTKLPLFAIFKGTPGGSIDRQLPSILPGGIIGCVQSKAWMDDRTMAIWYNKVYKPYIAGYTGNSGLILDDFICHKSDNMKQKMNSDNTMLYMIPPHYTGLLQPCDVGINKSLKDRLRKKASDWRRMKNRGLPRGEKVPAPTRYDVLQWLKTIWDAFPVQIVKNSFKGCGYIFEEGIDYSLVTESDSEVETENLE